MTDAINIEKKRFLPLLVEYRDSSKPEANMISVRFNNYKELELGWYPSLITYFSNNKLLETYIVENIQANIQINSSLLFPTGIEFSPLDEIYDRNSQKQFTTQTKQEAAAKPEAQARDDFYSNEEFEQEKIEKNRLENIIKSFKEKYP